MTSTMFLPLLVSVEDPRLGTEHLLDDFSPELAVAYSYGPPYGDRFVVWADLERLELGRRVLRRVALDNLYRLLPRLRIEGQPPTPMLSFGGLESSVLLADEVWADLSQSVPGELVVGVPARDVVIFTGSESRPGLAKVRRAVDRIFFAGDQHLLGRDLLVWRNGWSTYLPAESDSAASEPGPWGPPDAPPDRREPPAPNPERSVDPEAGRTEGSEPYRVPRQRSGDPGPTDWPERSPARRSLRRRRRPSGPAR
ncbi:hypothetical protein V1633_02830 [Plantactinospora sonchi]|uniref:Uncharacterized protein n=1 Tax=Plantactinospora sonchi TaxID=1544735 RepID=A0ABU7RLR1_9ACTN